MTPEEIQEIIQDTAIQVSNAIKSENSGFAPEILKEIKEYKDNLVQHQEDDKRDFEGITKMLEDQNDKIRPVIEAFEKRKIRRVVFEEESQTLVLYLKRVGIVGAGIGTLWIAAKWILTTILK